MARGSLRAGLHGLPRSSLWHKVTSVAPAAPLARPMLTRSGPIPSRGGAKLAGVEDGE
jgi:hypothetical protein